MIFAIKFSNENSNSKGIKVIFLKKNELSKLFLKNLLFKRKKFLTIKKELYYEWKLLTKLIHDIILKLFNNLI